MRLIFGGDGGRKRDFSVDFVVVGLTESNRGTPPGVLQIKMAIISTFLKKKEIFFEIKYFPRVLLAVFLVFGVVLAEFTI